MRIETLREQLRKANLDCYIVTEVPSVYYFTGFLDVRDAHISLIIPRKEETPILYVPEASLAAAYGAAKNCVVKLVKSGEKIFDKVSKELSLLRVRKAGFDFLQVSSFLRVKSKARRAVLKPAPDLVWNLRKIKSDDEISCMRIAAKMADEGIKAAVEKVRRGIREYEVAAEAEYAMRSSGSEAFAFDTIIASGPNSALPHPRVSDRKIREGDFVTIDIGAVYNGYHSDITRTIIAGKPNRKQIKIYKLVLQAQEKAFRFTRSGVKASYVDSIARKIIMKGGCGEYFAHGLGHGIGLDVHEPPRLNPASTDVLAKGNVVTDEPGIYIPSLGGVRIEDTINVLKDKAERLTKSPRNLMGL
jgi:Xaa-Pro dipeptidase